MAMNFWDGIAVAEIVALAGSWIWLRTKKLSYSSWRRKAALAALGCVSLAAFLDLANTGISRLIGIERVAYFYGLERVGSLASGLFAAIGTMACLSLILGLLEKAVPGF